MALGFSYGGSGGGADFLPIVKFDARAGRFFRVDREDGVSTPHDITRNFKAVFDFENLEVGWISFNAGSAPDFQMVPFGSAFGDRPSDNHKRGIRMAVKLSGECGGGSEGGAAGLLLARLPVLGGCMLSFGSGAGADDVEEAKDSDVAAAGGGASARGVSEAVPAPPEAAAASALAAAALSAAAAGLSAGGGSAPAATDVDALV